MVWKLVMLSQWCVADLEGGGDGRGDLVGAAPGVVLALGSEGSDQVLQTEQRQQEQRGSEGLQQSAGRPLRV